MRKRILFVLAFCGLGMMAASAQTFNFNVGGGIGGAFGQVGKATGASYNLVAGGGLNLNRSFGMKAEYMRYDLRFLSSVKDQQQLPGASGHVQSATLNLFFDHSLGGKWGVYGIGGGGWYQRMVDARSQVLVPGTVCQPAWALWGITCTDGLVITTQTLSSNTVDGFGYNFGGGLTYRFTKRAKFYVEGRYHHANTSDQHTTIFPVTGGLRW